MCQRIVACGCPLILTFAQMLYVKLFLFVSLFLAFNLCLIVIVERDRKGRRERGRHAAKDPALPYFILSLCPATQLILFFYSKEVIVKLEM